MSTMIPKRELRRLYIDDRRGLKTIARQFGTTADRVREQLVDAGIAIRRAPRIVPNGRKPLTRKLLEDYRYIKGYTRQQIADELGYDLTQIKFVMKRFGLNVADYQQFPVEALGASEWWHLLYVERRSVKAMADDLHVSIPRIRACIADADVPLMKRLALHELPSKPTHVSAPDLTLIHQVFEEAQTILAADGRNVGSNADRVSGEELRRLHHDDHLTVTDIAARFHTAPKNIRRRMNEEGIALRLYRRVGRSISKHELQRACELYAREDIRAVLDDYGVLRRDRKQFQPLKVLPAELLRRLYADCELSAVQISLLCGRSGATVQSHLRRNEILTRPTSLPKPKDLKNSRKLTRANLERAISKREPLAVMALRFGYPSTSAFRIAARALDVTLPDETERPIPSKLIRSALKSGISEADAQIVLGSRYLGFAGNELLPRWPWPIDRDIVLFLFQERRFSRREIAHRLRLSHRAAAMVFDELGIVEVATPRSRPFERWQLDLDELKRLNDEGAAVHEIAHRFGVSNSIVSRTLHRHHLPVRHKSHERRVLFDELRADPDVRAALKRFGIDVSAQWPSDPGPLSKDLLRVLVGTLGLSHFEVELVTGRDCGKIEQQCKEWKIRRRDPKRK